MAGSEEFIRNDSHINAPDLDEFDFGDYIQPLANRLFSVPPPFTVGVFGGWGTGKTSLMSLLRGHIEAGDLRAICIWFDAWKFDREETIWRAFLVHTLNALSAVVTKSCEDADSETKEALEGFLKNEIEPLRERMYRSFQKTQKGALKIDWEGVPKKLLLLLAQSFLPGVNIGSSLLQLIKGGNTEAAEDKAGLSKENVKTLEQFLGLIEREQTTEHFEHIRFLDQFNEEFKALVDKAKTLMDFERLVFFIDDLDRCLPDQAIQVLEAIKLFLSNEYSVFVVGIDEEVIHAGLDVRYRDLLQLKEDHEQSRRQFQQEYLEKIIQLPFTLPPLPYSEVRKFISARLNLADDEKDAESRKDLLIELMTRGSEYNPRKLKRVCNLFNLNWELAKARGIQERLNPDIIVKLVMLQLRARTLYQALIQGRSALLPMMERHWQAEHDTPKTSDKEPTKGSDDLRPAAKEIEPHPWIRPYIGIDWLKDFLLWQPPAGLASGVCTRFDGLENIEEHIQLKATAAPVEIVRTVKIRDNAYAIENIETHILRDLLHEDLAIIESASNKIAPQERSAYTAYLLKFLQTPDNPWRQRVSAGDSLGFLGDPRFEGERAWENEDYWTDIAAGEFYRGSREENEDARKDEYDGGKYSMEGFQIARYPVTNAEYAQFVEESKHNAPSSWKEGRFPREREIIL